MQISKVLDTITEIYHDPDYDRVPLTTYLRYVSDALNQILLVRPDANAVNEYIDLVEGNEQSLPNDGFRLIDVICNLDGDDKPTTAILKVEKKDLDNLAPNWMMDEGPDVYNYAYDVRIPKKFYVYPQVPLPHRVKVVYSKAFPVLVDSSMEIDLDEIFFMPLVDIVLSVLYRLDSEGSEAATQKTQFHSQLAAQALGIEQQKGIDISPEEGE